MNKSGFTLIELVAVIVLLGILAAMALPRFINLSSDAYLAEFHATQGAFKAAVTTAHLKWLAAGSPTGASAQDFIGSIDFNHLGYPAGIDGGAQVTSPEDCLAIFQGLMIIDRVLQIPIGDGPGIKNLPSNVDIAVTNNSDICYYTFVSESKSAGYNARQFRYLYLTGEVVEWPAGFTLY